MMAEIHRGRQQQKLAKVRLQADMADREYDEFIRVLEVNKKKEIEEHAMVSERRSRFVRPGQLGLCSVSTSGRLWRKHFAIFICMHLCI